MPSMLHRRNRNFKGLLLKDTQPPEPPPPDERAAPFARFIQSDGSSCSLHTPSEQRSRSSLEEATTSPGNVGGLSSSTSSLPHSQDAVTQRMNNLDLGPGQLPRLDLSASNLRTLADLGAGNGGTVTKVLHIPTGILMAKKVNFIDAKPEVRKQILRELQILHECRSEYIVGFYGASLSDVHIFMCMEYMDMGSLDTIYQKHGPIDVNICGKIVYTVVHGLSYLYEQFRIIHRDVKPSNILVNRQGQIKLCDFGVSGELINSMADTFVGTSTYMSPERIQGDQYSIKSDVWSLGVTVIEIAHGCFPFAIETEDDPDATTHAAPRGVQDVRSLSILELLQHIVHEPPPKLNPDANFPPDMINFVTVCLCKDPVKRPTPMDLRNHPFVLQGQRSDVNMVEWVMSLSSSKE